MRVFALSVSCIRALGRSYLLSRTVVLLAVRTLYLEHHCSAVHMFYLEHGPLAIRTFYLEHLCSALRTFYIEILCLRPFAHSRSYDFASGLPHVLFQAGVLWPFALSFLSISAPSRSRSISRPFARLTVRILYLEQL